MIGQSILERQSKECKGRYWRYLRTFPKYNWLPWQRPMGEHQMNF